MARQEAQGSELGKSGLRYPRQRFLRRTTLSGGGQALSGGGQAPSPRLQEQLDAFLATHQESVISRNRIINPLLELWDVVQHESPEAALPIERMLTALVDRLHTSSGELARMVEDVIRLIPDNDLAGV